MSIIDDICVEERLCFEKWFMGSQGRKVSDNVDTKRNCNFYHRFLF